MLIYTPSPIPSSGGQVTITTNNTDYKISRIEYYPTGITFISKSNYSAIFNVPNNTGDAKTYLVSIALINSAGNLITESVTLNQKAYKSTTEKVTLTINTGLDDCEYTFIYNGNIVIGSDNSVTVDSGTNVNYIVTKEGYKTYNNYVLITSDTELSIVLSPVIIDWEVDTDITKIPFKGTGFIIKAINATSLTATSSVSWITLNGGTSNEAGFTVSQGDSEETRTGTISCTAVASNKTYTKEFTVTQLGYVEVTPTSARVDSREQQIWVSVTTDRVEIGELPDWVTLNKTEVTQGTTYFLDIEQNTDLSSRECTITFTVDEAEYTFNLVQEGLVITSPIWKEEQIIIDQTIFDYTIGDYSGRAYAAPGEDSVTIYLNDICANSLESSIEFKEGLYIQPNYFKEFTYTGGGQTANVRFYNSWAYKDITSNKINEPIDDTIADGQYILDSYINTSSSDITIDGLTIPAYKGAVNISKAIGDCTFDYCLYYCNCYGGWDSLAVKGNSTKTDNIESFNYRNKLKTKYLNRITANWELNTGYTCDGSKMYNLIESTQVYLHNLKDDTIIPVVVTDTTIKYLNYSNNGKKPYYFTINVEEAQLKYRK